MSGQLTESNLKNRTKEYWEKRPGYDCYIKELLPRELEEASKDPARLRGVGQKVHTLALTVGESFEPLLQVVCVLKPQRIVLILNQFYSGEPGNDYGERLKQLMVKLSMAKHLPDGMLPALLRDDNFELIELPKDTPTHVFRALREAMQKPEAQPPQGATNVVDITGAKKSMVVGAFLYAAHSELPITYVDFDEYDTRWGKPYGYTCKISKIANPYEAFHLRDWEQVRRLYESYSFRNALALLGSVCTADSSGSGILGAMSRTVDDAADGESLFEPRDIARVQRLATLLEMYEAWENGDYAVAKKLKDGFNPPLPDDVVPWSIDALGNIWPDVAGIANAQDAAQKLLIAHLNLKQGVARPADSLFAKPMQLLAYVRDELAKIERLITKNEDYRSAYLRAAGLNEFLLKARLCMNWLEGRLNAIDGSHDPVIANTLPDSEQIEWFKAIAGHSGAEAMRDVLLGKRPLELERNRCKKKVKKVALTGHPHLSKYWTGKPLDLEDKPVFTKLRGEAIHTHLYIPRSVAEAALELVRAAVDEFETNWLEYFHPGTVAAVQSRPVVAPSWPRLCEASELAFLPPRLRQ